MKRVLIVGAGKRVKNAILPAACCMPGFDVTVASRSPAELRFGARTFTTVPLAEVELAGVDLVVIAVTLGAVPEVLARLASRGARHCEVMLDTPVLAFRDLGALRHLRGFARAVVAEDNITLPPFVLARGLIDAGAIGDLRRIYFFHNGYKYHALAGLKMLARSRLREIVNHKFKDVRQKEITLANGVIATMYEPRDYEVGKFLLVGTRGAIADFDHPSATHRIGYIVEAPLYRGLTLDGAPVADAPLDLAYREATRGVDIFMATPMNTMKIRGLMDLLAGNAAYAPGEAIEDALAITLADRAGFARGTHVAARLIDAMI